MPIALQYLDAGDAAKASVAFLQAAEIGDRFGDADLMAMARHGWGRALVRMGDTRDGVRLLDEAMVAAEVGDVSLAEGNAAAREGSR